MGALITGIVKSAATSALTAAIGKKLGATGTRRSKGVLTSKTAQGATAMTLLGIWPSIGPALQGDPTAIGNVVLWLLGYAWTLYGRYTANKPLF